jgi:hypothetical protein
VGPVFRENDAMTRNYSGLRDSDSRRPAVAPPDMEKPGAGARLLM